LPAAVAVASTEPDPIFAAIEEHRTAFMRRLKAGRIYSHLGDVDAPGYQAPEEADAEAYQAKRDAEFDLVETEPTTHAGIVALLAYVDDFHTRAFADPDDPK
jgi:hypothetical protein